MSIVSSVHAQSILHGHFSKRLQQDQWQVLDTLSGAALLKKEVGKDSISFTAYLQVIDPRYMKIVQWVQPANNEGLQQGKYLSKSTSNSPYYKRLPYQDVLSAARAQFGNRFFSATNGVFFEEYNDSTQLSFPIKKDGKILTGGSSLYGPVSKPANEYYRNVELRALFVQNDKVFIRHYNPATGYPLNLSSVKNAIVTYEYHDHPARVLGNNMKNRFHLLATISNGNDTSVNILLLLTVDKTTLNNAANLLQELGVTSDILVIDGGSSVFINNRTAGTIEEPGNNDPLFKGEAIRLPHYFFFVSKK